MDLVESQQRIIPLEKRHPWELARLEVVKQVIREFVRLNPGANVLDVGCGDSFLVSQVAKDYPTANFIAVDTALTPELAKKLGEAWAVKNLAMFQDLESADRALNNGKASLILLLDVIEHIEDDIGFLKHLQTFPFFTGETTVIISVPAFQKLFCSHDTFLGHYRRYNNRRLDEHTAQAGLRPVKTTYFFSSLLPPRVLQVFKERCLKIVPKMTTGLVEWNGSPAIARALKAVLLLDFKATWLLNKCGLKFWGLSNLTVCKAKAAATGQPRT